MQFPKKRTCNVKRRWPSLTVCLLEMACCIAQVYIWPCKIYPRWRSNQVIWDEKNKNKTRFYLVLYMICHIHHPLLTKYTFRKLVNLIVHTILFLHFCLIKISLCCHWLSWDDDQTAAHCMKTVPEYHISSRNLLFTMLSL